jgi:hypothetical protein
MRKLTEHQRRIVSISLIGLLIFLMVLLVSSFGISNSTTPGPITQITHMAHPPIDTVALMNAINPPEGFQLQIVYGQVGPHLLATGSIDLSALQQLYRGNGQTLSDQELKILTKGSQEAITINRQNASFLLKLFWALGLTNQNPILGQELIQTKEEKLEGVSSISGWKLSLKPAITLYSKEKILLLSPNQQRRVEQVARAVFLPCCDNPVYLPDCSYSMALLGLLELMGSQDASEETMFIAAKHTNAFWFPQQTLEQAIFLIATQLKNYSNVDARTILSDSYSSARGFQRLHQWLAKNGMLIDERHWPLDCLVQ